MSLPNPSEMEMPSGRQVTQIAMGTDLTVILDNKGQVYRTGGRRMFVPTKMNLPKRDPVKKIFASGPVIGYLTEGGDVWLECDELTDEDTIDDAKVLLRKFKPEVFEGGKVVDVFGDQNMAAIVEF